MPSIINKIFPNRSFIFWVYAIFLTTALLTPATPSSEPALLNDKLMHFLSFSLLGWLARVGFRPGTPKAIAGLTASLILYGLLTECGQALIPSRSFEWLDWVADSVGVLAGIAIFKFK